MGAFRTRAAPLDPPSGLFFSGGGKAAHSLFLKITDLCAEFGALIQRGPATIGQFSLAALTRDFVVIDISVEQDNRSAYDQLDETYRFCHVFVVSRTCVPQNLSRYAIAPPYPFPRHVAAAPDVIWSDDDILDAFRPRLRTLFEMGGTRLDEAGPRALLAIGQGEIIGPFIEEGLRFEERLKRTFGYERTTFLSYRSTAFDQVGDFAAALGDGTYDGIRRQVRLVRPGELAVEGELLTPANRWRVVWELWHRTWESDEFIAFCSEDYLSSWWTTAEFINAVYSAREGRASGGTPLSTFYHRPGAAAPLPLSELAPVTLAGEVKDEINWIAVRSHPDYVREDLDSGFRVRVQVAETLSRLPWIRSGLNVLSQRAQEYLNSAGPPDMEQPPDAEPGRMPTTPQDLHELHRKGVWNTQSQTDLSAPVGFQALRAGEVDVRGFIDAPQRDRLTPRVVREAALRGTPVHIAGRDYRVETLPRRLVWNYRTLRRGFRAKLTPHDTFAVAEL